MHNFSPLKILSSDLIIIELKFFANLRVVLFDLDVMEIRQDLLANSVLCWNSLPSSVVFDWISTDPRVPPVV